MGSILGTLFRISTWGESHGGAVGAVVDGCPARLPLSESDIQPQLNRRRPGQSRLTSPRSEPDRVRILSGVFEGKTLGTPILLLVENRDARPGAYEGLRDLYRPSHADFTYGAKYGIRDWRGGGRSSARETVGRVAAGAIAEKILRLAEGIEIVAWVASVGTIEAELEDADRRTLTRDRIDATTVRCPEGEAARRMEEAIDRARRAGDSLGGVVEAVVRNVPPGLGEPVFDRLEADLGRAMLSLPAAKGFEIGSGFSGTRMTGSEHNDPFYVRSRPGSRRSARSRSGGDAPNASDALSPDAGSSKARTSGASSSSARTSGASSADARSQAARAADEPLIDPHRVGTRTNRSGGVQGGISNGEPICFRVAFKPTATIRMPQETITIRGEATTLEAQGRHDPCVLPRAVPLVESMAALVLVDHWLRQLALADASRIIETAGGRAVEGARRTTGGKRRGRP